MAEQTTQPCPTPDGPRIGVVSRYCLLVASARRAIAQALVRAELVVIMSVGLHDMVQLPQAETEQQVQALPLEVGNPVPPRNPIRSL